jgi:DmsE family decaheme c-type cytochrome
MRSYHQVTRAGIGLTLSLALVLMIPVVVIAAGSDSSKPIADDVCLGCHDGLDQTLKGTPHRLASETTDAASTVACVKCHTGAATHIDDPSADNIGVASRLTGHEAAQLCTQCHEAHVSLDDYGFNVHSEMELNCTSCHKIHGQTKSLMLDNDGRFCLSCHEDKVTNFMGVSNHPVFQGPLSCLSCHRFVKRQDDNLAYETAGVCARCHPQQAGPFMYEHDATTAYAVDGGGCMECHRPHGSENNYLLRQPGQDLCRQCHMTPPKHEQNNAHGVAWAKYECVVCHTDIHGSFDNNLFLDPNLPARWGVDCYQSGCHDLNR